MERPPPISTQSYTSFPYATLFRSDVAEHQFAGRTDAVPQQCGDVAGTAGQVQHPVALAHLRRGDEIALPDPMDAHRHRVVHQVVVAGHRREHLRSEEHTSELP